MKYYETIQINSADVFTGPVDQILPENLPIWFKFPPAFRFEHLSVMHSAATNNTIAKSCYFNGQRHEFRFNENFRFTGGEDTELFNRICNSGGVIRFVEDAVVKEIVAQERISIKWMLAKQFSNGNLAARGQITEFGNPKSTRYWVITKYFIQEIFKQSGSGIMFLLWGVVTWPFSKRSIRYIVKGLKKIWWVSGVFSGFVRIEFNLYKKIEGH